MLFACRSQNGRTRAWSRRECPRRSRCPLRLRFGVTAAVDCFRLDRHALSATGRGARDAVDGLPSADPFFLSASEIKRPRALFEAQSTPISELVDLADLASGSQRPAIYSRIFDSECRARMRHEMSPHTNLALTWK